jgi:DNA protecting protein DprA
MTSLDAWLLEANTAAGTPPWSSGTCREARLRLQRALHQLSPHGDARVVPVLPGSDLALGTPRRWVTTVGDSARATRPGLAVVGTRGVEALQGRAATLLDEVLGAAPVPLVSGGAIGIDALAHRFCLQRSHPITVVLAGGLLHAGPAVHRADLLRIPALAAGLLLSDRPPWCRPARHEFRERNRLIAALSDAVLLVRAPLESGARITCRHARRMGRPIFVLDWQDGESATEGLAWEETHGAIRIRRPEDIWHHPGFAFACRDAPERTAPTADPALLQPLRPRPQVDPVHRWLTALLQKDPSTLDDLMLHPQVTADLGGWMERLLAWELQGWVERGVDGRLTWTAGGHFL